MASNRNQSAGKHTPPSTSGEHAQLIASAAPEQQARPDDTRTLHSLQALTDAALSHLSLDALLPELLERVRAVMQVDNIAILILDEDAQELELSAARGVEEEVVGHVRVPVGAGFAGRIAANRKPLAIQDLSTYPVNSQFLSEKLHSVLGVPLLASERLLGVVHIGSATPRHFTATEVALLEQVADRIARAVERAQSFAALEASRQLAERRAAFLTTTLEALGDGVVVTDAQGKLLYGNPAYSALLGAATKDTREDALPPEVSSRLALLDARDAQGRPLSADGLAVARALRGETHAGPNALEVQIRRLDGQEAYLSITGAPVRNATGAVIGAVMALRDVTERRRLEQQARSATRDATERALRLEAIFASVADGLFVYDGEGHVVEHNPAAEAMLDAYVLPEARDVTVAERGRQVGGLRDFAGRALPETEWPQARIARGEVLVGASSAYIRLRRRDGRDTFLNVSGAPLRDEQGAIVGSVCLYRDLTDRWELSEALEQRTQALEAANARLRTLLDVLPVGVAMIDLTTGERQVNRAFHHLWGDDASDGNGEPQRRGWWAATGKPLRVEDWAMARVLASGAPVVDDEIEIETLRGERRFVLNTAAPLIGSTGAVVGGINAMLDITDQKRRSERTRDALEAFISITRTLVDVPAEPGADDVPDSATTDSASAGEPSRGTIAHRLALLTRGILGCSRVSIDAVEGERMLLHPVAIVGLTLEQEREWWIRQAAQEERTVGEGLLPADRQRFLAGEVLTFDLTRPPYNRPNPYGATSVLAAPMRTQGRMVGQLVLDFQDPGDDPHVFTPEEMQITEAVARLGAVVLERERLLSERESARAEALALAEANRRMDEFLGIAGHELRTPLTTMKANLQLSERRTRQILSNLPVEPVKGAETREAHRVVQRRQIEQLLSLLHRATLSVERQERLVQDLLDISRISANRLEYRMALLDLPSLIRETVEEQRVSVPDRRIALDLPAEPMPVYGDADRLGQVLTNYLTNALKYSASDKRVTVSLRRDREVARVEVRDDGPGLSPAQQRLLFERFQRVPGIEVMSGSGVGLGLGLYISKTIVAYHGGDVGVESETGKGSTFWFTVPLLESSGDSAREDGAGSQTDTSTATTQPRTGAG